MTSSTDTIPLIVNSRLRSSGTATQFNYRLSTTVDRVRKITAIESRIPYSFWAFNSTNNVLILNDGANVVTLEPGTYNLANFQVALISAFNNASPVINSGFSISYSVSTGLLTITNATTPFKINALDPLSTLAHHLGFQADSATALSLTGDSVMDIAGPQFLYVTSAKLCKYYVSQKTLYANDTLSNAIAIIGVNTAFGGYISSTSPLSVVINDKKGGAQFEAGEDIDFTLYDDRGRVVDLNGQDWILTLQLEQN